MLLGNFIEYKGFVGSIEYDEDDDIYYGTLINIEDLVNYHGRTLLESMANTKTLSMIILKSVMKLENNY